MNAAAIFTLLKVVTPTPRQKQAVLPQRFKILREGTLTTLADRRKRPDAVFFLNHD